MLLGTALAFSLATPGIEVGVRQRAAQAATKVPVVRLEGSVHDRRRIAPDRCLVSVFGPGPLGPTKAMSHRDAIYEFEVEPGIYWVVVSAPGYMLSESLQRLDGSRPLYVRDFVLRDELVVPVRVRNAEGKPLDELFRSSGCSLRASFVPPGMRPRAPDALPEIAVRRDPNTESIRVEPGVSARVDEAGKVGDLFFRTDVGSYVSIVRGPFVVATIFVTPESEAVFVCDEDQLSPRTGVVQIRARDPQSATGLAIDKAWIDGDIGLLEGEGKSPSVFRGVPTGKRVLTVQCRNRPIQRALIDVEAETQAEVLVPEGALVDVHPVAPSGRPYSRSSFIEVVPEATAFHFEGQSIPGYRCRANLPVQVPMLDVPYLLRVKRQLSAEPEWVRFNPHTDRELSLVVKPEGMAALVPAEVHVGQWFEINDDDGKLVFRSRFPDPRPFNVRLTAGMYELLVTEPRAFRRQRFEVGADEVFAVFPED